MHEHTEAGLPQFLDRAGTSVVFWYTPLCGTCKVAERMLDILHVMRPNDAVIKANINQYPQLAQRFRIESVPCLLEVKDGAAGRRLYAFGSIDHVHRFLTDADPSEFNR